MIAFEKKCRRKIIACVQRFDYPLFNIRIFNQIHLTSFKDFKEVVKNVDLDKLKFVHSWLGQIVKSYYMKKEFNGRKVIGWTSDSILKKKKGLTLRCINVRIFTSVFEGENIARKLVLKCQCATLDSNFSAILFNMTGLFSDEINLVIKNKDDYYNDAFFCVEENLEDSEKIEVHCVKLSDRCVRLPSQESSDNK